MPISPIPVVYVAGPYTNPDPVHNTHRAIEIADDLLATGFIPVVPHLTLAWHLVSPKPVDVWYDYDLHVMLRCDAVYRFPGASTGADAECRVAAEYHIPVFHDLHSLKAWKVARETDPF